MNKADKLEQKLLSEMSTVGIDVINLSAHSQAPIVSERIQDKKPWVFWGLDNLYPTKLISLADNSALHSAILDTKAKMIAGTHLVFEKENGEAEKFFNAATEKWGGPNELINRLAVDVAHFKGLTINVAYEQSRKINAVRHFDFSTIRSGKMNPKTGLVEDFWYSTRWDIATRKTVFSAKDEIYRPVLLPAFNPSNFRNKEDKVGGQLIFSKSYSPSNTYYPKPSYIGATNYIDIVAKIAVFHKSQLENGMNGNMHIHIPRDLSNKETRLKVLNGFKEDYTGERNAGRILLTYGTGEANRPTVTPISNDGVHEALTSLNEKANQEIVSAHAIPRQLAQLDLSTGFGGLELAQSMAQFQTMSISPSQVMIEDKLNAILKHNEIKETVKIGKLEPSSPILTDALIQISHTVDEIRAMNNKLAHTDSSIGKNIAKSNDGGRNESN